MQPILGYGIFSVLQDIPSFYFRARSPTYIVVLFNFLTLFSILCYSVTETPANGPQKSILAISAILFSLIFQPPISFRRTRRLINVNYYINLSNSNMSCKTFSSISLFHKQLNWVFTLFCGPG